MSDIDARDGAQRTALHRACEDADVDKVKYLLKKKASVNLKDKNNWTPLHCAASAKSLEIVKMLLKAGADPTMITNTETTALHYLSRLPVETGKKKDAKDGLLAVLKTVLEKGARVNAKNSTGMTALHEAAYKGCDATIAFLLKNGASLEEKDKYGETPLHYAMRAARKENVAALLAAGAKADVQGTRGTPKDVAADGQLLEVVQEFDGKRREEKNDKAEKEDDDGLGAVLATNADDLPDKVKKSLQSGAFSNDLVNANFKEVLHILQFITRKRYINLDASLVKRTDPLKVYSNLSLVPGQSFPSTLYNATNAAGEKFLIRRLPHEKKKAKIQNLREIALLAKLDHVNLPSYVESYIYGDECWLVMEGLEGALLKSFMKVKPTENDMSFIIRQVLKVLYYFQQGNLVHRTITSSNLFITTNGDLKLLDLKSLNDIDMISLGQMVGLPAWMAPEVIFGQRAVTGAVDIWSVGLIAYEMANGALPTTKNDLQALFLTATDPSPPAPNPSATISPILQDFINVCLSKDPEKRPAPEELYKHEFIATGPARTAMLPRIQTLFSLFENLMPEEGAAAE